MQGEIGKKLLVPEIIGFELVALKSVYYRQNACHQESMCEQTVSRF